MRNIWVSSDHHFNHENIIKYCDRPFTDVTHMNEYMLDCYNSVVKDGDIAYFLGDVYMGDGAHWYQKIAPRLHGRKRLILGNHDNGKDQTLQKVFQKITLWRAFPEFGLLLTHVPVSLSTLGPKWPRNVHGHIHNRPSPGPEYINVSVEVIDYTPVHIEDIRDGKVL